MTISISNPGGGGGGGGLVADAINDGTTTVAPSQNAVFDALALKVPTSRTIAGLDLSADRTAAALRGALGTGTPGSGNFLRGDGAWAAAAGSVATDALYDAKGDLPAGTGADTAAKLTVGADGTLLVADSNSTAGLRYVSSPKQQYVASTNYLVPDGSLTTPSQQNAALPQRFGVWLFYTPVRRTFTVIGDYCYTLESGSTLRFGFYNINSDLTVGSLIADEGTVSGTTTGWKSISISRTIEAGWFGVATWQSNHSTVRWERMSQWGIGPLGQRGEAWGQLNVLWGSTTDYSAGLPTNPSGLSILTTSGGNVPGNAVPQIR